MTSEGEMSEMNPEVQLPQARIFFSLPTLKEVSYKDLFDSFLKANGVEDLTSSSEESESENYSYPAFMQRIIERLDKYGQLALREQIGKHKSEPKKKRKVSESEELDVAQNNEKNDKNEGEEGSESSEDSCELYYDLSDNFIDDTDILQNNNADEGDLKKSIREGFGVFSIEEADKIFGKKNKRPQQKTPKKTKEKTENVKIEFQKKPEVDIGHLDVGIKNLLDELRALYESKRKEGNAAPFPKGSVEILEKTAKLMEDKSVNYEGVYNNISIISGQMLENVKNQFDKIKQKAQKSRVMIEYKKKLQVFKKKIQSASLEWSQDLRSDFLDILDRLKQSVSLTNEGISSSKSKKKPLLIYDEEEKKVTQEIKKLNPKLEKLDFKCEISSLPKPIKSENFIEPTFDPSDF